MSTIRCSNSGSLSVPRAREESTSGARKQPSLCRTRRRASLRSSCRSMTTVCQWRFADRQGTLACLPGAAHPDSSFALERWCGANITPAHNSTTPNSSSPNGRDSASPSFQVTSTSQAAADRHPACSRILPKGSSSRSATRSTRTSPARGSRWGEPRTLFQHLAEPEAWPWERLFFELCVHAL